MAMYKAVILDVDGTLVDSNAAHARAWQAALQESGYQATFERIFRLVGMGGDHLIPEVTGQSKDSQVGKAIAKRRGEIFAKQGLPTVQAFPQTHQLLLALREHGLRLAVASSAEKQELEPLLALAGATELVEVQTSAGDAQQSKPDPDIVQAALNQLGLPGDQVMMLGDTPYDIAAATTAGIKIIALRCGGWNDSDLNGALAIFNDPGDLLAQLDKSPLVQDERYSL